MDYQKIGKKIKEQRDKLGLSQYDLGEKVHVTRQAVSNWETGKTLPDSDVLISLSKLFKMTINEILCTDSIEETALELIEENNKKTNKLKRITWIFSISILSLCILFLILYFINNYNSIKVYKASSTSDHFKLVDGLIISTSKNTYFKLGNLEKTDETITINRIKLYYIKENQEKMIYESDVNDRLYIDPDNQNNMYKKIFNKYKNKLYLRVNYNDTEQEVLKINLLEDYKNDYFLVLNNNKIIKDIINKDIPQLQVAYRKEETEFQKNILVRRDETKPLLKYEEPVIVTTIKEETPITNGEVITEELNTTNEEETIIDTPSEDIQPDPINIDFDEIINIIETYGVKIGKNYVLEYVLDEGTIINISEQKRKITLNTSNICKTDSFIIRKNGDILIQYQTINKNLETEYLSGSFNDLLIENKEIIDDMYYYLSLVYQEIQ